MPANTANRSYPYSLPTDTTDIPGDLQRLAEAIDDDVCALTDGVTGRPVSRFRGTGTFASLTPSLGGTVGTLRVPFDTVDFNLIPATMQSQEAGNRLIKPEVPGFYFVTASIYVPTLTLTTTVELITVVITKGNASTPLSANTYLAGTATSLPVGTNDQGVRLFTVSVGTFMNGTTDAFALEFFADTNPDVSQYVINERVMTMMRMTQS